VASTQWPVAGLCPDVIPQESCHAVELVSRVNSQFSTAIKGLKSQQYISGVQPQKYITGVKSMQYNATFLGIHANSQTKFMPPW
jgi:hypothetical protein